MKKQGYLVLDGATAHNLQTVACKVFKLKSLQFLFVGQPKTKLSKYAIST
jgi:hypothetical protein